MNIAKRCYNTLVEIGEAEDKRWGEKHHESLQQAAHSFYETVKELEEMMKHCTSQKEYYSVIDTCAHYGLRSITIFLSNKKVKSMFEKYVPIFKEERKTDAIVVEMNKNEEIRSFFCDEGEEISQIYIEYYDHDYIPFLRDKGIKITFRSPSI